MIVSKLLIKVENKNEESLFQSFVDKKNILNDKSENENTNRNRIVRALSSVFRTLK